MDVGARKEGQIWHTWQPKGSLRGVEGCERIADMAAHLPQTRLLYVADREADLMPLMR